MEEKRVMGVLKGKKDIRDFKIKKKVCKSVAYPEEFECSRVVKIKNQGAVGSCVAHSAAEILEWHCDGQKTLSTNFIYGIHHKLYGSEGPGMYLREACKIAHDYGDPEYDYCPGNTEVEKVYNISEKAFNNKEALDNAINYRINKYALLRTEEDKKYALMNYGPLLGAITWYDENKCVDGVLQKGSTKSGGHAIMVLGWNKQGWVCQNSWGKYWGNNGYFILPYDYKLSEAFSFVPIDKEEDIIIPDRNKFIDFIYKIINWIINLF